MSSITGLYGSNIIIVAHCISTLANDQIYKMQRQNN